MYTSGSPGRPKGVIGTHRATVNRLSWMWRQYPFQREEICCQKTSLSFVDSVWEIFGPLLAGVPVVIFSEDTVKHVEDRKSTRLNSSHSQISYAVFCLKKKKNSRLHRSAASHLPLYHPPTDE